MLRTNETWSMENTDVSLREHKAHDVAEKVLANILGIGPLHDCSGQYQGKLARLAVAVCARALYCTSAQLGTYLQLLSALGTGISEESAVGICDVLNKRLEGLVQQIRRDSSSVSQQCLERIVRVSTALSLGLCDGSAASFDWADPRGGIAQCIERAIRGASSNCAHADAIFSLATHAVQAVAAMLWMKVEIGSIATVVEVE
eukprot:IDg18941t1